MRYIIMLISVISMLSLPAIAGSVEAYVSEQEICMVEKDGDEYRFLSSEEFVRNRVEIESPANHQQYEWFFVEKKQENEHTNFVLKAKVYPEIVDNLLGAPRHLFKIRRGACVNTPENQQLAQQVSYEYQSKDLVCVAVLENNQVKFVKPSVLATVPSENWVYFFYEGGKYNQKLVGIVPAALARSWEKVPEDFLQKISVCPNHTGTEEYVQENIDEILEQYDS